MIPSSLPAKPPSQVNVVWRPPAASLPARPQFTQTITNIPYVPSLPLPPLPFSGPSSNAVAGPSSLPTSNLPLKSMIVTTPASVDDSGVAVSREQVSFAANRKFVSSGLPPKPVSPFAHSQPVESSDIDIKALNSAQHTPNELHTPSAIAAIPQVAMGAKRKEPEAASVEIPHSGEGPVNGVPKAADGSVKTHQPIPILPTPLPSKRFRKNPLRKATLFPIEQIPTFPLPPLPPIDDPVLLKQVFTHQSLFEKVKGKFEDAEDDLAKHYEKLEHVGDSLLGMIVTTWLHELKPGLTPGTATQLKAHLVSNATLSHLSGLYNLPQRLIADPNLLPLLRASTDTRAALVEAYIAAVYMSHPVQDRLTVALHVLNNWLREMYEPLYDFFYTYMKREHDQHSNAVGADDEGTVIVMDEDEIQKIDESARGMFLLVKMHCEAYEREMRWEEDRHETNIGTLFKMSVIVDGMELGEATRAGKNQAKDVAAWEAAKKLGLAA